MAKPTSLPYGAGPTPEPYHVSLRFKGGGSDKVYKLSIEQKGDGWVLNYANGRYGGTMSTGTKTQSPVDYPAAMKACNSQLSEKVGKGYLPTEGSRLGESTIAEAIETVAKAASGHVPQLCNSIDDDEVEFYLRNDAFAAQPKHNGERRLVIVEDGQASGGNRKGQKVALPKAIRDAASAIHGSAVLDGEQVGDVVYVWDLLERDGRDLRGLPMVERFRMLSEGNFGRDPAIRISESAFTEADKRALLAKQSSSGGEGVVFKRTSSPYVAGRPNSGGDSLKFKLYKTLSAVVSGVNAKRSVSLALLADDGSRVPVGNVTIPTNKDLPKEGDVVEVRYLYAYEGGSLYQPNYEGLRGDISPEECLSSQRAFRAEVEDAVGMTL